MNDFQVLVLPLLGFAAHLAAHIASYKVTRGKIGLYTSLLAGFVIGWLAVIAIVLSHSGQDIQLLLYRILEGGLCFSFIWYCFFHFVNIGETSLRIRVLGELQESGRAMSFIELSSVYNPRMIVEARLARLRQSGEIGERAGQYSVAKPKLLLVAKVIRFLRLILHGEEAPHAAGRIVILGGGGFIGRHLTALVESHVSLSRRDVDLASAEAAGQLSALLKPMDKVIILSALTPEHGRDEATREKNIEMMRNVAEALRSQPVNHVTLVSSDAVYDSGSSPFSESTPLAPADNYGQAHAEREKVLRQVCAELLIPLAVFRPCAVYGPGDTHNSYGPKQFAESALHEGKIKVFGQGEERRDFVHVGDLCMALAAASQRSVQGTFNVATGRAVCFLEVAKAIQGRAGRSVEIQFAERTQPAVDRLHKPEAFSGAFPEINFRPLDAGLDELLKSLKS